MKRTTLILDRKSIEQLVDIRQSFAAVENAFKEYGKNRVQMPSKIYLHLNHVFGKVI